MFLGGHGFNILIHKYFWEEWEQIYQFSLKTSSVLFTIKGNSFQRKYELITTPFLLEQPFVCNWSSIHLRTNYTVQNWSNILESFITILYEFEKQWLNSFAWKAIVVRPVQQNFICLVEDRHETFHNEAKCNDKDLIWHMLG